MAEASSIPDGWSAGCRLVAWTETRMVEPGKKNKPPALPPDVQVKIGEKLKAIYDDVVRQPVPDRFKDLLSKLDSNGTESLRIEAEGRGK
jgi:hypothetical protein